MLKSTITVEYHCNECEIDFEVFHVTSQRNTHCCYCGKEVQMIGVLSKVKLKSNEIIIYKDNIEVERRPITNPLNKPK